MEKIKLKNGKEIVVEGGMTQNYFETVVQGYDAMKETYNILTDDNLERVEVLNDAGIVCAVLENKRLAQEKRFENIADTENIKLKVSLEDVDIRDIQLAQNTANIDYLVMMNEM